jgi:hypothetical protein
LGRRQPRRPRADNQQIRLRITVLHAPNITQKGCGKKAGEEGPAGQDTTRTPYLFP